jgi:hypothetical protein
VPHVPAAPYHARPGKTPAHLQITPAEHALACFTHRITGVQAVALATSGPALVWTSTARLDLLTSNGVRVWFGERGTTQAAEA